MMQMIFTNFWEGQHIEYSLQIINVLLDPKYEKKWTDKLLKCDIITKLEEYISSESTFTTEILIELLELFGKLLDFGETINSKNNPVARLMQNRNIFKWLSPHFIHPTLEIVK
jgi:hypothetical protein